MILVIALLLGCSLYAWLEGHRMLSIGALAAALAFVPVANANGFSKISWWSPAKLLIGTEDGDFVQKDIEVPSHPNSEPLVCFFQPTRRPVLCFYRTTHGAVYHMEVPWKEERT